MSASSERKKPWRILTLRHGTARAGSCEEICRTGRPGRLQRRRRSAAGTYSRLVQPASSSSPRRPSAMATRSGGQAPVFKVIGRDQRLDALKAGRSNRHSVRGELAEQAAQNTGIALKRPWCKGRSASTSRPVGRHNRRVARRAGAQSSQLALDRRTSTKALRSASRK